MVDVSLTYRRRSTTISLPESWSEVKPSDAPKLLAWAASMPADAAMAEVIAHYVPRRFLKRLDDTSTSDFVRLFQWYTISPGTEAFAPYVEIDSVRYYMPLKEFSDGTAIEYPLADEFYQQIREHQDDEKSCMESMRMLAATLYREYDTEGNRVKLTGRKDVSDRFLVMEGVDDVYLLNALYYFSGIKSMLASTFGATIFQVPDEDDADEKAASSPGPIFGWWGTYFDIAEAGLFGDLERVHQTNFITICMYLSKKYLEAQERKEQDMVDKARFDD